MKFALDHFTPKELDSLVRAAEKQKLRIAKRRPIAVVRAEVAMSAASLGYSIEELFSASSGLAHVMDKRAPRRRSTKAAVKYRDPENKKNTWSGRGSQPRWLREKVRRGMSPADFLIEGIARPTANRKSIGKRTVFKQN